MLDKVLVATQLLVHHIGVQHTVGNHHHNQKNFLIRYTKASILPSESVAGPTNWWIFLWEDVEYIFEDKQFVLEATDVLHLVHGWPDQGCNAKKVDCSILQWCTLMIFIPLAWD
jgi:hypothetical protein